MKRRNKIKLQKRVYFAIALLVLLIAAGIMTAAFTLPTPGSPTHSTLFTDTIVSMSGSIGKVTIDSSVFTKNITATGGGAGNVGILGSNTEGVYGRSAFGAEGRLGYNNYGVYTPGKVKADSIETNTLGMTGDLSAKSLSTTGANPNGYGVYSPSSPVYGSYFNAPSGYYGGYFYGSGVSTGSVYASSTITASGACDCGTVNAGDWVQANKGFMANGNYGVGSATFTFLDITNTKRTLTVERGIVTFFG